MVEFLCFFRAVRLVAGFMARNGLLGFLKDLRHDEGSRLESNVESEASCET